MERGDPPPRRPSAHRGPAAPDRPSRSMAADARSVPARIAIHRRHASAGLRRHGGRRDDLPPGGHGPRRPRYQWKLSAYRHLDQDERWLARCGTALQSPRKATRRQEVIAGHHPRPLECLLMFQVTRAYRYLAEEYAPGAAD